MKKNKKFILKIKTITGFYKFLVSPVLIVCIVCFLTKNQEQNLPLPGLMMYALFSMLIYGLITGLLFVFLILLHKVLGDRFKQITGLE